MPTELFDDIGQYLAVEENEKERSQVEIEDVGGLMRRWLEEVACLMVLPSLALTKIDVLDGLEKIKICVGYRIEKEEFMDFDHFPC